ncbi:unnamed protein product [Orchesella dallaii]|uniref:Secreted protein n=1 Tax=Orchesella dallaii TaxID=48710 RepID=A0ABP1Q9R1_9HEXA
MHSIRLIFQVITLIGTLSRSGAHNGHSSQSKHCQQMSCDDPPKSANCIVVEPSDTSLPRPKGKHAECCPLWKCTETGQTDFFTFHATPKSIKGKNKGGTEIVSYGSTLGNGVEDIFNVVSSIATGNHGSFAFASSDGSPPPNEKDLFAEFANAFKGFSLK